MGLGAGAPVLAQSDEPAKCIYLSGSEVANEGDILGLSPWHKYLCHREVKDVLTNKTQLDPVITNINDLWKVGLAAIEILTTLALYLAFAFIIVAGFMYMISRGDPNSTANAKNTLLYAVIGLIIAMFAKTILVFIGAALV
jgi:hypothetical protein